MLLTTGYSFSQCTFEENGGLLVIEAESAENYTAGQFALKTGTVGNTTPTGTGYLRYEGPNHHGAQVNADKISYTIKINNPGTYQFLWRNVRDPQATSGDAANDAWIFIKNNGARFYGKKGSTEHTLTKATKVWVQKSDFVYEAWGETHVGGQTVNSMTMWVDFPSAGEYTVDYGGRSQGHSVDRIVLFKANQATKAKNIVTAESTCADGTNTGGNTGNGTFGSGGTSSDARVSGELNKWNKLTVTYDSPNNLQENEGTFKNNRVDVVFTSPTGKKLRIPAFFSADGNAANSGAKEGKKYKAHLRPNETGVWTYQILRYTGTDVAIKNVNNLPAAADNITGTIGDVKGVNANLPDLRAKGRLLYQTTGSNKQRRYLRFKENGEFFLKIGPDSPENILDYDDFDHDVNKNGCGLCKEHFFNPHAGDYKTGNPTWKNGKGKNIMGALNYIKAQDMNSFSMSLFGGDDKNVFPWINPTSKFTYDVSKLAQWEMVFDHAENIGLMMHYKLAENENWDKLNSNEIKVFYREMIARFGHHLAIEWNISEEYRGAPNTAVERINFLAANDAYSNHRVIHTYPGEHETQYNGWISLGVPLTGASIQSSRNANYDDAYNGKSGILTWINKSKANGTPWVVASDEQNSGGTGIFTDDLMSTKTVVKQARSIILWKTLIAGGAGTMWYGGSKGDFQTENFDRFENLFKWSRYAVQDFFRTYNIEYWNSENKDNLVSGNRNHCLANDGNTYVVYLENGGSTNLNLNGQSGTYKVKWFDTRNGGTLKDGNVTTINGGGSRSIGNPPNNTTQDWAVLVINEDLPLLATNSTPTPTCQTILSKDFDKITGIANYDAANKAAIPNSPANSANVGEVVLGCGGANGKTRPCAAEETYTGPTGDYFIKLSAMGEPDGECNYEVFVNGTKIGEQKTTRIFGTNTPAYTVEQLQINNTAVELKNGDIIRVTFNQTSNDLVPEGNGFATARGRWRGIELCPDDNIVTPVVDEVSFNTLAPSIGSVANIPLKVNYTASKEQEVVAIINSPTGQWLGNAKTTVQTGTNILDMNIAVNPALPIADGYKVIIMIRPVGSGAGDALDSEERLINVTDDVTVDGCDEFEETNGFLVIEAESAKNYTQAGFTLETDAVGVTNPTGDGYLRYTGPDHFSAQVEVNKVSYSIKINNPGTYRFQWRNVRDPQAASGDAANDAWIFIKGNEARFYGKKNGTEYDLNKATKAWIQKSEFDFSTNGETHAGGATVNSMSLWVDFPSAGIYTMEYGGRSNGHSVDRMILFKADKQTIAKDLNTSETKCSVVTAIDESESTENSISIYPNPVNDFIKVDGLKDGVTWRLMSMQSAEIMTGSEEFIDLSSLNSGNYFILFSNGQTTKIIKGL